MRGALRAVASPLLLLAMALAGCAVPSSVDGTAGGRDVGDTWTIEMRYTEGGTFVMTLDKRLADIVQRQGQSAYEVAIEPTFEGEEEPGQTVQYTWTEWVRVSDLAAIEMRRQHEGRIAPPATQGEAYDYSEDSTTIHAEACPSLVGMQLEVGREWTATCHQSTSTMEWSAKRGRDWHNHTSNVTTTYRVQAHEEVRVEAGTFLAYRVTATTEQSFATIWVVPDGCWTDPVKVEHEYENDEHSGRTETELLDADC